MKIASLGAAKARPVQISRTAEKAKTLPVVAPAIFSVKLLLALSPTKMSPKSCSLGSPMRLAAAGGV